MSTYGERLEEGMAEKGLKQDELAKRVGLRQQSIQYLLSRGRASRYNTQLARELGLNPDWLATGQGPKYPSGTQDGFDHISPEIIDLARKIQAAPENVQQGIRLILEPATEPKAKTEKPRRAVGREPKGDTRKVKKRVNR